MRNTRITEYPRFQFHFQSGEKDIKKFTAKLLEEKDSNSRMATCRVIVAGDDLAFHEFVQRFMEMIQQPNHQIDKIDYRIYVIPYRVNTLAHYLALHDDLYCQQIYQLFCSVRHFP